MNVQLLRYVHVSCTRTIHEQHGGSRTLNPYCPWRGIHFDRLRNGQFTRTGDRSTDTGRRRAGPHRGPGRPYCQTLSRKITADIDILGFDFPTAINRAIKRSPSYNWIELLSGIRNTITIGGELGDYLEEKAEGYIQDYKRKVKKFNDTVSIFMNVYITLILVGIVFFIIMSSLMSTIGGMSINMLKMSQIGIVFVGLPVVSLAFILLIKTMSPWTK